MLNDLRTLAAGAVAVGVVAGLIRGASSPLPPSGSAVAHADSSATVDSVHLPAAAPDADGVSTAPPRPAALTAARGVLDGFGIESGVERGRVQLALGALQPSIRRQSDPDGLRVAFQAYYNYQAAHPSRVRKPYLYYVDYGLDARTPRGWVFDMRALKVVEGPFMVAHGRGSAPTANGIPTRFSNRQGSNATSLGLYLAQETYGFRGTSSGRAYTSVGLRLAGVSGGYNSAARARGVVVHGAPYVTAALAGRSEGCPAMEQARARRLLPRIANGGMVFHFSPRDAEWRRRDPWINRG
jgi:hypothetical protein